MPSVTVPSKLGTAKILLWMIGSWCATSTASYSDEPPQFSRDILPILSESCFACHGPDAKQEATSLRLDQRDRLLTTINLEHPESSEFLLRIESKDMEDRMPPSSSHKKPLTERQIMTLRRWIEAGAPWGKHWALEHPQKVTLPDVGESNPIDAFVVHRLQQLGRSLSTQADPSTLERRLALDITGLPPSAHGLTPGDHPRDWPRLIETLLASPHHAERMAMWWLDLARYADTDGYQADATRENWPWRDWVIMAFQKNMPFDQFTREQFAGDLLPNATDEQKLATCFHRNHMTNGEGGRDPEESRVDYVIDRVNTVGTVWLGLTLGCCQCHSHKFDPISQKDYYSLSAFFNSIDEDGKAGSGAKPFLTYQSSMADASIAQAKELVDAREPLVKKALEEARSPFESWLADLSMRPRSTMGWQTIQAVQLEAVEGTHLHQQLDGCIEASGPNPNQDDYRITSRPNLTPITGLRLEVLPSTQHPQGALSRGASGEFILTDVKVQVQKKGSSLLRDIAIRSAVADYSADKKKYENYGDIRDTLDDDPRNGWTTKGAPQSQPHQAIFEITQPLMLEADEELILEMRHRSTLGDANIAKFRWSVCSEPGEAVRKLDATPLEAWWNSQQKDEPIAEPLRERLFQQYLENHESYQLPKRAYDRAVQQWKEMKKASEKISVMVLSERPTPRETFVLVRGLWDKHGELAPLHVPEAIAPWPESLPKNRLGLAEWIVSRDNPLTARVIVNHLWQSIFGQGLVRTQEDFGLQGDRPSHPELLDWLAVELMQNDWDLRHILRLILNSKTYQQSSLITAEALQLDPENRWLARGSRYRLPSWMLRDAALAHGGLLNPQIGGPPVRPYQPDGVWEELFMGRFQYIPSEGALQYRRTLYAFWRRSIAPTFLFDSAQRRTCEVRQARTNTPLQALTLWNDATYLEASKHIAIDAIAANAEDEPMISWMVRRVLHRDPTSTELQEFRKRFQVALNTYRSQPSSANEWLSIGQYPPPQPTPPEKTLERYAAAMVVASMLLNLDEAMTHE